jgi:hypothetical protein
MQLPDMRTLNQLLKNVPEPVADALRHVSIESHLQLDRSQNEMRGEYEAVARDSVFDSLSKNVRISALERGQHSMHFAPPGVTDDVPMNPQNPAEVSANLPSLIQALSVNETTGALQYKARRERHTMGSLTQRDTDADWTALAGLVAEDARLASGTATGQLAYWNNATGVNQWQPFALGASGTFLRCNGAGNAPDWTDQLPLTLHARSHTSHHWSDTDNGGAGAWVASDDAIPTATINHTGLLPALPFVEEPAFQLLDGNSTWRQPDWLDVQAWFSNTTATQGLTEDSPDKVLIMRVQSDGDDGFEYRGQALGLLEALLATDVPDLTAAWPRYLRKVKRETNPGSGVYEWAFEWEDLEDSDLLPSATPGAFARWVNETGTYGNRLLSFTPSLGIMAWTPNQAGVGSLTALQPPPDTPNKTLVSDAKGQWTIGDAGAPATHAATHLAGGADAIPLAKAPDGGTPAAAGLMRGYTGFSAEFLDGTGAFRIPPVGLQINETDLNTGHGIFYGDAVAGWQSRAGTYADIVRWFRGSTSVSENAPTMILTMSPEKVASDPDQFAYRGAAVGADSEFLLDMLDGDATTQNAAWLFPVQVPIETTTPGVYAMQGQLKTLIDALLDADITDTSSAFPKYLRKVSNGTTTSLEWDDIEDSDRFPAATFSGIAQFGTDGSRLFKKSIASKSILYWDAGIQALATDTTHENLYLRKDGSWATPIDNNTDSGWPSGGTAGQVFTSKGGSSEGEWAAIPLLPERPQSGLFPVVLSAASSVATPGWVYPVDLVLESAISGDRPDRALIEWNNTLKTMDYWQPATPAEGQILYWYGNDGIKSLLVPEGSGTRNFLSWVGGGLSPAWVDENDLVDYIPLAKSYVQDAGPPTGWPAAPGLLAALPTTDVRESKWLRGDNSWQDAPAASTSAAGVIQLEPSATGSKYLNGAGQWTTPPNTWWHPGTGTSGYVLTADEYGEPIWAALPSTEWPDFGESPVFPQMLVATATDAEPAWVNVMAQLSTGGTSTANNAVMIYNNTGKKFAPVSIPAIGETDVYVLKLTHTTGLPAWTEIDVLPALPESDEEYKWLRGDNSWAEIPLARSYDAGSGPPSGSSALNGLLQKLPDTSVRESKWLRGDNSWQDAPINEDVDTKLDNLKAIVSEIIADLTGFITVSTPWNAVWTE